MPHRKKMRMGAPRSVGAKRKGGGGGTSAARRKTSYKADGTLFVTSGTGKSTVTKVSGKKMTRTGSAVYLGTRGRGKGKTTVSDKYIGRAKNSRADLAPAKSRGPVIQAVKSRGPVIQKSTMKRVIKIRKQQTRGHDSGGPY